MSHVILSSVNFSHWLRQRYVYIPLVEIGSSDRINPLILEIVVWIYDTFNYYFEIENDFTKYLKESCS